MRKSIYGDTLRAMHTTPTLYDYVMVNLRTKTTPQRTIARDSGVPYGTLTKIAQGQITNPRIQTLQRLADYFAGKPQPIQPTQQEAA